MGHYCSLISPFLPFHFTIPVSVLALLFLQPKPENAVTIAVSSRVLFRTEREQKVFEQEGVEEYLRYQIEHENEPFAPGPAFPFVKVTITHKTILFFQILFYFLLTVAVYLVGSGGREHSTAGAVPTK